MIKVVEESPSPPPLGTRIRPASVLSLCAVAALFCVIGTAAAALCPLWPAGAQLLIRSTEPPVWWLLNVARYAADMPAAAVPVPSGVPGVVTVAIAVAGVAATWHWAVSPRRDTIVR